MQKSENSAMKYAINKMITSHYFREYFTKKVNYNWEQLKVTLNK